MGTLIEKRNVGGADRVAKRLPRPANPVRARCELDQSELRTVEDAAHHCRLSVASFIRVALIDAAANAEERSKAWGEVADRIAAGTPESPPKKPGRPKKEK